MRNLKKLAILFLMISLLAFAVSCGGSGGGTTTDNPDDTPCTTCVDSDKDGKCDKCGKDVAPVEPPHTECVDNNDDGKCDECGEDVATKQPCDECVDADKDGKCDECGEDVEVSVEEELVLIKDKTANFHIVVADGVPSNVIREVDNLIKKLRNLGVTVTREEDIAGTVQSCEILVGTVKTRGEQYQLDIHVYGENGYAVKVIDGKVCVVGGSDAAIPTAIKVFTEQMLGITDSTKKVDDISVTSANDIIKIQDDYRVNKITLEGEDIRGYTIAVDKTVKSAYTTAQNLQQLLYAKTGYWLPIVDPDAADKSIVITLADKTGGEGYQATISEGRMEFVCEYSTAIQTEITDFFNRKIVLGEGTVNFEANESYEKNVRDVYYRDFGAVGDGETDDLLAIIAAHEYANEGGHPVFATPGDTYYIGNNNGQNHFKGAIIQTDTTWSGAYFIVDDSKIGTEEIRGSTYARQVPIFKIVSAQSTVSKSAALAGVSSLSKDATNIGFAPGYPALVLIQNSNQRNFIRYGENEDNGQIEKEVVLVDAEGNIDPSTPLMWEYETVTSFTIYPISDEPITVQGGHFTTIYNQAPCVYRPYERGIMVCRSNVTVRDIVHVNTGEGDTGAPSGGFTIFEGANNILFENITYDNMKGFYDQSNGTIMGSYEISGHHCANVTWKNCTQNDFWRTDTAEPERYAKSGGIMGSSFNKDLAFYDCVLSSFDAHCGVQDLIIKDSIFEHINCTGGGTAILENVEIHVMHQKNAIMLRGDYGSPWKGDFYFKNCTLVAEDAHEIALFDASWANWDFGFDGGSQMPTNVYVENITIDSEKGITTIKLVEQDVGKTAGSADKPIWTKKVWETTVDGVENKNPYKITENWIIVDDKGYDYIMPPDFTTKVEITRTEK